MHLETHDPVHHVHTRPLERPRPPDVVLLVEPCLELNQRSDRLAPLPGLEERFYHGRLCANPVQRDLDGQDLGVPDRLAKECHHGREALVRVKEHDVLLPDAAKDLLLSLKGWRDRGDEGGVFEVRPVKGAYLHEVCHAERRLLGIEHVLRDPEFPAEERTYLPGHARYNLDPHGRPNPPHLHSLFDCGQQVRGLVLLDLHVRVPCDPERVRCHDVEPGEEVAKVCTDDVFQKDKADIIVEGPGRLTPGDAHQSREEVGGDLDPGKPFPAAAGVFHLHGERYGEVRDEREWVGTVERKGSEDREDLLPEESLKGMPVLFPEFPVLEDRDAGSLQGGEEIFFPERHLLPDERKQCPVYGPKLPGRAHAVRGSLEDSLLNLPVQPRDPDHEELVEVVGEDREELDPFQEGVAPICRLLEHPPVELDPGEFPVDEEARVFKEVALLPVPGHHPVHWRRPGHSRLTVLAPVSL